MFLAREKIIYKTYRYEGRRKLYTIYKIFNFFLIPKRKSLIIDHVTTYLKEKQILKLTITEIKNDEVVEMMAPWVVNRAQDQPITRTRPPRQPNLT